jgi:hypothetical protein
MSFGGAVGIEFARKEHPLALFLDDWQCLDTALAVRDLLLVGLRSITLLSQGRPPEKIRSFQSVS